MANWRKLLRPGPTDLGTSNLADVIEPDTYVQRFAGRATKDQGYPWEGVAGTLVVQPWNPVNGNVIAVFYAWTGGVATNTFHNGAWRGWRDALGRTVE